MSSERVAEDMIREARLFERIALRLEIYRVRNHTWGDGFDRATSRAYRDHGRSLRRFAADILADTEDWSLLGRTQLAEMRRERAA